MAKIAPGNDMLGNRKDKESSLKQQTMKAYKPVPTVKSAAIIFSILGIIFIIVGSVLLAYSKQIIEHSKRYDNIGSCKDTKADSIHTCTVTFNIDKKMNEPVYFYYQLNNFYQNHRRYVKSKSSDQLSGSILSKSDVNTDCDPVITMKDLGFSKAYYEMNNLTSLASKYNSDTVANPCGMIAKTFFNDTYSLFDSNNNRVPINEKEISWPSDRDKKFKNSKDNWKDIQWHDLTDEHFIVWMRTSGLPNFRKLWGKIEEDLEGVYTVKIDSRYDVTDFDGEKYVVISTANALGGDNSFLGIAYIVVGGITLILALAFVVRGYLFKKPEDLHR